MRASRAATLVLLALSCAFLAGAAPMRPADPAERAFPSIRAEAILGHMTFLADDLLEGRGTATRGHDLAARYVAAQFAQIGLAPAGDSGGWFQAVPLLRADTQEPECRLALVRDGRERVLAPAVDYFMQSDYANPSSSIEAPLVFAGFGVTAPELGHDDYAGLDVRGKVVVLLTGSPKTFPHNQRAYHSHGDVKAANAVAHGARGILSVRPPIDEVRTTWDRVIRQGRLPGMRWRETDGRGHDVHPELAVGATMDRRGAEALFEGAERSLAQVFADVDTGRTAGFPLAGTVKARRVTRHTFVSSPNVAGLLRGSDPRLRDEVLVVSAHLDHLGISAPVHGDSINNGAFDNATGIATIIELARALKSLPAPKRSILFLAVTGEEKGLQGSDYFARHSTLGNARIVANLNLDMFLMLGPLTHLTVFGAEHSSLGPLFERAATRLGVGIKQDPSPEEVIFVRSDQYSFVKQGVPAIFPVSGVRFMGADSPGTKWMRSIYHTPQDDLGQHFELAAGVTFTRINLLAASWIANAPERPRWNAGDWFGERFGRVAARSGS